MVGTPAAYLLGTRDFRGRSLAITLIELPLVVPPAVAGIALLAALGPNGILGGAISDAGIELVFQTAGVVVALTFVAAPFYLRQAIAAFESLDPAWLEASRTLGAGPARTFLTVAVPSARPGLASGTALAWGRALGEFGATLMFAGSFPGITQTAPLAIFARFGTDFTSALALSAVLIAVAGRSCSRSSSSPAAGALEGRRPVSGLEASMRLELRDFDLELELSVGPAQRLALVGPSGAGKTTVMRVIAGLLAPGEGRVALDGEVWLDTGAAVDLAPELRGCGYLFQEYALFPRMSAWRNVAFGIRGAGRAARRARAVELLERFGCGALAEAAPGELSGGERQRVALARALAPEPALLLLDEPLSALDPSSRAASLRELDSLLAGLEIPILIVTHSYEEAALLGERIAVLDRGSVVQQGTPAEVSAEPASAFVADFTGAVVLRGSASADRDGLTAIDLEGGGTVRSTDTADGPVALSVFPWEISLEAPGAAHSDSVLNRVGGEVQSLTEVGNRVRVGISLPQAVTAEVTARSVEALGLRRGSPVTAAWKATATRILSAG